MKTHVCGCKTYIDPTWGIERCHTKCQGHIDELAAQPRGEAYYQSLGCFVDGQPMCDKYIGEIFEALGITAWEQPPPYHNSHAGLAVEIGGGASMYCKSLLDAGYHYVGMEPDEWGADWTADTYHVRMEKRRFETLEEDGYNAAHLVLCAHAVEHMPDAPKAMGEMFKMLAPGRPLYLIVPDDTDPLNPDHWWFFNVDNLRSTLQRIGFIDIHIAVRKLIERENFLYCSARKP